MRLVLLLSILFYLMPSFAQEKCRSLLKEPQNVSAVDSEAEFKFLLKNLKKDKFFKKMLEDFNEKEKGITIEQHVTDVFNQYLTESRFSFLKASDFRELSSRMKSVMPLTIALHDIGKPLAIEMGDRNSQHIYTISLMKAYLYKLNWKKEDIDLSLALVSFTGLGDLAKKQKSVIQVFREMDALAKSLGVSVADFYEAKKVFFFSDAGAYSQLRSSVFIVHGNGKLESRSGEFEDLETLIYGDLSRAG